MKCTTGLTHMAAMPRWRCLAPSTSWPCITRCFQCMPAVMTQLHAVRCMLSLGVKLTLHQLYIIICRHNAVVH